MGKTKARPYDCFHALACFLAFDGGRERDMKGNVCVSLTVDKDNKTVYMTVNFDTEESAIELNASSGNQRLARKSKDAIPPEEQGPFGSMQKTWGLLFDLERRKELLGTLESEVTGVISTSEEEITMNYYDILEFHHVRLSKRFSDSYDYVKEATMLAKEALGSVKVFESLPSMLIGESSDAVLREVEKLCNMAANQIDDGVYDPILCAELFVLNKVAGGLLDCSWDALFQQNDFFEAVKHYSMWKSFETHIRETVVKDARSLALGKSTASHWKKLVKIDANELGNSDGWMSSVFGIVDKLDVHETIGKRLWKKYVTSYGLYQWIKARVESYRARVKEVWDNVEKPLWFICMRDALDCLSGMTVMLAKDYEGKVLLKSANAAHDVHCEVALFHLLSTRETPLKDKLKSLTFYISRPLCGRCLCHFFGCISDEVRPSVLDGCRLHRKQKLQFPGEASVKEGNDDFIDLQKQLEAGHCN